LVLGNIGNVHQSQGNYTEALEQYQKSLKISEDIGDKDGIALILSHIGSIHQSRGNYTEAMEQYQKSLKIAEEIGNKADIANTLGCIGEVHQIQGNYSLVLQFAERAADLYTEIGHTDELWQAHSLAGTAYFALNQLSQARLSFDQAIAIIENLRAHVVGGEQE